MGCCLPCLQADIGLPAGTAAADCDSDVVQTFPGMRCCSVSAKALYCAPAETATTRSGSSWGADGTVHTARHVVLLESCHSDCWHCSKRRCAAEGPEPEQEQQNSEDSSMRYQHSIHSDECSEGEASDSDESVSGGGRVDTVLHHACRCSE